MNKALKFAQECSSYLVAAALLMSVVVQAHHCYAEDAGNKTPRFGVGLGFENYRYGYNINTTLRYSLKSWPITFYGGILYHMNNRRAGKLDGLDSKFGDFSIEEFRWAATTPGEHIGFKLGFEKYIRLRRDNYKLFWFYDFEKNTMTLQYISIGVIGYDTSRGFASPIIGGHGEVWDHNDVLKNNLGLGLSVNLTNKLYLKLIAGGGFALMRGYHAWEWGYLIGLQAHYELFTNKAAHK